MSGMISVSRLTFLVWQSNTMGASSHPYMRADLCRIHKCLGDPFILRAGFGCLHIPAYNSKRLEKSTRKSCFWPMAFLHALLGGKEKEGISY